MSYLVFVVSLFAPYVSFLCSLRKAVLRDCAISWVSSLICLNNVHIKTHTFENEDNSSRKHAYIISIKSVAVLFALIVSSSFCTSGRLNFVIVIGNILYMSQRRTIQQNGMCAQRRLKSAWASAQSDQSLCCALSR